VPAVAGVWRLQRGVHEVHDVGTLPQVAQRRAHRDRLPLGGSRVNHSVQHAAYPRQDSGACPRSGARLSTRPEHFPLSAGLDECDASGPPAGAVALSRSRAGHSPKCRCRAAAVSRGKHRPQADSLRFCAAAQAIPAVPELRPALASGGYLDEGCDLAVFVGA